MHSIKTQAEILRVALTIGLIHKADIIKWTDRNIEKYDDIDYRIYEISLHGNYSKADIALELSEIKGDMGIKDLSRVILGIISKQYHKKIIDVDECLSFLYGIVSRNVKLNLGDDIESRIHYLSDGYYLATQNIYGDVDEIIKELDGFMSEYYVYADEFDYLIK